jgi:1-acyl-sn-glycerol-3-phosphate acyltransferase
LSSDPEHEDVGLIHRGELDELRSAVSALRGQLDRGLHGAAREHGAEPEPLAARLGAEASRIGQRVREQLEELDVLALFNDLRKRMRFLPVHNSELEIDEFGVDQQALASAAPLFDFLFERWWRVRVAGLDQVPRDARVLFVANRSGVLPYDGLMIAHAVARAFGESRRPRFLIADWLAGLPFAQSLLAGVGGVRACAENAERLLRSGHWLIAFPEGQKGALKLFHDRYRLQRFARGGFVSIALREDAVIVPVGVVGAEEVHPVLYESAFASRLLGVPALVTPTFPHLGPLGLVPLPSQWQIRFGEPISFSGVAAGAADDPLFVNRATARIRGAIQRLLDEEVRSRRSVF